MDAQRRWRSVVLVTTIVAVLYKTIAHSPELPMLKVIRVLLRTMSHPVVMSDHARICASRDLKRSARSTAAVPAPSFSAGWSQLLLTGAPEGLPYDNVAKEQLEGGSTDAVLPAIVSDRGVHIVSHRFIYAYWAFKLSVYQGGLSDLHLGASPCLACRHGIIASCRPRAVHASRLARLWRE